MERFRITFARTEPLRYTGNLDMQKVWERYLRRSGIPVQPGLSPPGQDSAGLSASTRLLR